MFAKSAASGADMVFLDLEDAYAPAEREKARGKAAAALRELDWIVVAARAAGIDAIDAPFPHYRAAEAYRTACDRAAAMGYVRKWAIHPSQVEIANTAFAPTPEEIEHAGKVVAAYRKAEATGRGATGLDGMLVDAAHRRHAAAATRRIGSAPHRTGRPGW